MMSHLNKIKSIKYRYFGGKGTCLSRGIRIIRRTVWLNPTRRNEETVETKTASFKILDSEKDIVI